MTVSNRRRQSTLFCARLSALEQGLAAPTPEAAKGLTNARAASPVPSPPPSSTPFPMTRLLNPSHDSERDIRLPRTLEVLSMRRQLKGMQRELQAQGWGDGGDLYNGVRHLVEAIECLEGGMEDDFVPQHAQLELVSPRSFFTGCLFNVKNRSAPRAAQLAFLLDFGSSDGPRYIGPELRQDDGLVFMALLNLCRDYRVGKQASFDVAAMTMALGGRYNGQKRTRLKRTIQRLQRATIEFPGFTVQLVQRFEHPKSGEWSVALDRHIVEVFRDEQTVWLDLSLRLHFPEGLTSWLYCYVRSQTKLIPWRIVDLQERCGSDGNHKTFREMLGKSLRHLANVGVIDSGWSLDGQLVRWRKPPLSEPALNREKSAERGSQMQMLLLSSDEADAPVRDPNSLRSSPV